MGSGHSKAPSSSHARRTVSSTDVSATRGMQLTVLPTYLKSAREMRYHRKCSLQEKTILKISQKKIVKWL